MHFGADLENEHPPADKNYHFLKNQLYDFMYTEDQTEIRQYNMFNNIMIGWSATSQEKKLRNINAFLKLGIFLIVLNLPLLALIIPGINLATMLLISTGLGVFAVWSCRKIFSYDSIIMEREGKQTMWLRSPSSLLIFPSLLKTYLRTTAWLHDMVAAIPRLIRYYSRKGTNEATFEDSIKRGGAWGSLIGSICTVGGVIAIGLLLFNPYTLLGITGIVAATSLCLFAVPRIVKCFEFLGRLASIFYTKKLAERELNSVELQNIRNKKHEKDLQPACKVAFVNSLPTNDDLTKMRQEKKEIPHYYYHREVNDKKHISWICYSVNHLPSGRVEAILKPCYRAELKEVKVPTDDDAKNQINIEKVNTKLKQSLKKNIDTIYTKHTEKIKASPDSTIILNQAEAESLQLDTHPKVFSFAPEEKKNSSQSLPKTSIFRSTTQICWQAFQDILNPRNFAGRQSGKIIFNPSYASSDKLLALEKKGTHLESDTGKEYFKKIFLPSYERYALILKKNLEQRDPRENSTEKPKSTPGDITSIMAEYITLKNK